MSVKSKLTVMFLAIASIPLIFVSALTFHNYRDSLEALRFSQLKDLIVYRADKIETYFEGLKTHIEITQGYYNIKQNLPVLTRLAGDPNNQEFLAAKKMLDDQLRQMQSISGLADIMLVNPDGKVVYTTNPKHHRKDFLNPLPDPQQKAFDEGKTKVYFSDIFPSSAMDSGFELLVTALAHDSNGTFIGVIAFEVDMAATYSLLQDVTGLGKTGEVLLGKKNDHQVLYLNPLRHDPKAALNRRVTIGDKPGRPIQEAVQGKTGSDTYFDYRDKQVIAAWRYLPSMDWGLVAKIDTSEAFADVTNLRNLTFLMLAIVLALSGAMAYSLAQSIAEPIKKLSKGAEIIGSGNLDYKVGTNQTDELGRLSRTFDKMTHDLKQITASRDELNREITERKRAEDAMRHARDELARSNKDLEQFAYVASHDLQEPLRAISGFVDLFSRRVQTGLDEQSSQYLQFIIDGASRMRTLINGLLEYSRVGTHGITPQPTDLKTVIDRAVMNLHTAIQQSSAKITTGQMPTIPVDPVQMTQLFQNLIGNALKFSGTEQPKIHISAAYNKNAWHFAVKDNGIGIDSEYAEKIFLIFQRLHTREKYPGTGIGLAICKKIVERHGGKIWVESSPGQGSTFNFTIPDGG